MVLTHLIYLIGRLMILMLAILQKLQAGMLQLASEQWGTYSVPWISHGGSTSHSWPISFNSSCFAAVGIAKSSAVEEWRNTNEISAVTTNSFTWNRSYEEAGSFMAFAIGQ